MVEIYAIVSLIAKIGAMGCIVVVDHKARSRNFYLRSRVSTEERPVYVEESAALHSLQAPRDWRRDRSGVWAGSRGPSYERGGLAKVLEQWRRRGALALRPGAASPLVAGVIGFPD